MSSFICFSFELIHCFYVHIQGHQDIVKKLVDLIGITSIMEVGCRLLFVSFHI